MHACLPFGITIVELAGRFPIVTFCCFVLQIVILEDRKVFGSRGQILKDELVGKHGENSNRSMKQLGPKLVNLKLPVIHFCKAVLLCELFRT